MMETHANPEDFDLYALGALDGEEQQAFESHLRSCPACRQELAAAARRTALLGLAVPPLAPSAAVKSALLQRLGSEHPSTMKQTVTTQPRKRSWGLRFSLAFATVAVIFALAASLLWKQDRQHQQLLENLQAQLAAAQNLATQDSATLQAVTEVVGAPDTTQIALLQQNGGPPGQAHVLYNARLGIIVYSGQIAPPPADKSYQLWLIPAAGAPV